MYIRKLSTLNMNVSFRTSQSKADKSALIDSGATDNFIDEETWKQLGIGKKELARPVTVISSISSTERGEVFYGLTDWLGSRDPLTPVRYTCGSPTGLAD
jgi:hypothetical protein